MVQATCQLQRSLPDFFHLCDAHVIHTAVVNPFQSWKCCRIPSHHQASLNAVDEARDKGRTQFWTFLHGAVLGMLHHILQRCSGCGLSPSAWTVALQVALPWEGAPPGSKEQDRGIPT